MEPRVRAAAKSTIVLLLVFLSCVSCASTGGTKGAPEPAEKEDTFKREDGLKLTFSLDSLTYRSGEPVPLRLEVKNVAEKALTITFTSSKTHDFLIEDETGDVVWQWSAGRVFAQALKDIHLEPGEARIYSYDWKQIGNDGRAAGPGKYRIISIFPDKDQIELGPLHIEIVE